ncbi:MAG: GNAT family N-acetyltransferase [Candidatus Hydrogenedentes bacterium]|nr:GNAT family N-acetyltransferase [Candidatus Hydrogenedentota bacterium]
MKWSIEALAETHERKAFCSGIGQLDAYLHRYAGQHTRKDIGRTFVAVSAGSRRVAGYYTLSASSVAFQNLPDALARQLPRYPLPAALIGKLAVDKSLQGQGLGELLLLDALKRVVGISSQLALYAVEVHAINDQAKSFYTQYGFQPFLDDDSHLFLPIETIRKLLT